MVSVSLHDLGIDRLSIEERIQVAEAIWNSFIHDVEAAPIPIGRERNSSDGSLTALQILMPCSPGAMSRSRPSPP